MKTFIKHILFYIALFTGLILTVDFFTSSIINKYANFKLAANPRYVILGHSHPECAFNDSLIPDLKNLSASGEAYFYTYFKAKKILEQNPSIEIVLIEYTNNQITPEMDAWTWYDENFSDKYSKYAPFMALTDQFILMQNNPKGYLNSFSYSNRIKLNKVMGRKYDFTTSIGGYKFLVRNRTDSLLKLLNTSNTRNLKHDRAAESSKNISATSLVYLKKTIELCKRYGKKVLLVRSPQRMEYTASYNNESTYKKILSDHFSTIEYLDFSNFPLANSEFGDLGHLNYKGARVFSEWIAELINNGLLEKTGKQKFIDDKIKSRVQNTDFLEANVR